MFFAGGFTWGVCARLGTCMVLTTAVRLQIRRPIQWSDFLLAEGVSGCQMATNVHNAEQPAAKQRSECEGCNGESGFWHFESQRVA